MPHLITGLRLPFSFDPERLHADLALIGHGEWSRHYNERDFGGEWTGAALRSATGLATEGFSGTARVVPCVKG